MFKQSKYVISISTKIYEELLFSVKFKLLKEKDIALILDVNDSLKDHSTEKFQFFPFSIKDKFVSKIIEPTIEDYDNTLSIINKNLTLTKRFKALHEKKITLKRYEELYFALRFNLLNQNDLSLIFDIINSIYNTTICNDKETVMKRQNLWISLSVQNRFNKQFIPSMLINQDQMWKVIKDDNCLSKRFNAILGVLSYQIESLKCYDKGKEQEYMKMIKQLKSKVKHNGDIKDEEIDILIEFIQLVNANNNSYHSGQLLKKSIHTLYNIYIMKGKENILFSKERQELIMNKLIEMKNVDILEIFFKKSEIKGCYEFILIDKEYKMITIKSSIQYNNALQEEYSKDFSQGDILWNVLYDIMNEKVINCDLFIISIISDEEEKKIYNSDYSMSLKELYNKYCKQNVKNQIINFSFKEIKGVNSKDECIYYKEPYFTLLYNTHKDIYNFLNDDNYWKDLYIYQHEDFFYATSQTFYKKTYNDYNNVIFKRVFKIWNILFGFKKNYQGDIIKMFVRNNCYHQLPRYYYSQQVISSVIDPQKELDEHFNLCLINSVLFEEFTNRITFSTNYSQTKIFFILCFLSKAITMRKQFMNKNHKDTLNNLYPKIKDLINLIPEKREYISNQLFITIYGFYYLKQLKLNNNEFINNCIKVCESNPFSKKAARILIRIKNKLNQPIKYQKLSEIIKTHFLFNSDDIGIDLIKHLCKFYIHDKYDHFCNLLIELINTLRKSKDVSVPIFKEFSQMVLYFNEELRFLTNKNVSRATSNYLLEIIIQAILNYIKEINKGNQNDCFEILPVIAFFILLQAVSQIANTNKKIQNENDFSISVSIPMSNNMLREDKGIQIQLNETDELLLFETVSKLFYDFDQKNNQIKTTKNENKNYEPNNDLYLFISCMWFYQQSLVPFIPVISLPINVPNKSILFSKVIKILYNSTEFKALIYSLEKTQPTIFNKTLLGKLVQLIRTGKDISPLINEIIFTTTNNNHQIENSSIKDILTWELKNILDELKTKKLFKEDSFYFCENEFFFSLKFLPKYKNLPKIIEQIINKKLNVAPKIFPILIEFNEQEKPTALDFHEYVNCGKPEEKNVQCEKLKDKKYKLTGLMIEEYNNLSIKEYLLDHLNQRWIHKEGSIIKWPQIKKEIREFKKISNIFLLYQLFENKSSKQTKFENIIETEMDNIALQQQSNTVNMLLEKKLSKMQQIPYLKFVSFIIILIKIIFTNNYFKGELVNSTQKLIGKTEVKIQNLIEYIMKIILNKNVNKIKKKENFDRIIMENSNVD